MDLSDFGHPRHGGDGDADVDANADADSEPTRALPRSAPGRGVLEGAFAVLDALCALDEAGLVRLSQVSGLPKATVHRLLGQLAEQGAVVKTGDRYRVGPRMFALGQAWRPDADLLRASRAPMRTMVRATGASVGLCVLVNRHAVLAGGVTGRYGRLVPMERGMVWPTLSTGAGRILLAWADPVAAPIPAAALPSSRVAEIRQAGVVFDQEATVPGVCCAAVPVFGAGRAVPAAMWAMTDPSHPLPELARILTRTSALTSAAMG